ncbi:hypothetical protein [Methanobrevibacter boviskoreani]|uniref:hypothetical protein n=1 Tax=Methanobrevibacter boviskoreani TaxID=1348249 RepID=UPI0023F02DB7|nr:hypothetical protein [Methanobrevibacter boviskoreani]MDD6256526.1 hypothetical protein [Methanobrevibacter boviskoreani]
MKIQSSTFKISADNVYCDENTASCVNDLNFQSSTCGFHSYSDSCEDYYEFVEEMSEIQQKVFNGDLSDFEELQL